MNSSATTRTIHRPWPCTSEPEAASSGAWFKRVMSAGEAHIEAAASQLDLKVERVGDKAIEEIGSVHVAYRPSTPGRTPRTDPLEVRVVHLGAVNDALRLGCQFGYDGAGQYVGDGDVAQFSDERVECQSVDRSETG